MLKQHKTGLINIGQACYMNAILQSLSNILVISTKLLEKFKKKEFKIDSQPLVCAYSSLLFELFYPKKNEKYIDSNLLEHFIEELNPLFKGMHASYAKDFIFFILEKLHQELSQNNNNKIDPQINFEQKEKNTQNEKLMLQLFNDYSLRNNSIISDTFYGVNRSIMKCNNCGVTKYSFQAFNLLKFQLKKVKEEKFGGLYSREKIGLLDAFIVEQKQEILKKESKIYCNSCHGLREGIYQKNIYKLPPVLVIILDRGKNYEDFKEEFYFPTILDLTNQNIVIDNNSCLKFYLYGIVTHLGQNEDSGNFITYCRSGPDSPFYCYNDTNVFKVKEEDAIKTDFSKKSNIKKIPYILIYHNF